MLDRGADKGALPATSTSRAEGRQIRRSQMRRRAMRKRAVKRAGPSRATKKKAAQVLVQMRRGVVLCRTNGPNSALWALSPGRPVSDEVARIVISNEDVVGVGDALFDRGLSQTWRWAEGDRGHS